MSIDHTPCSFGCPGGAQCRWDGDAGGGSRHGHGTSRRPHLHCPKRARCHAHPTPSAAGARHRCAASLCNSDPAARRCAQCACMCTIIILWNDYDRCTLAQLAGAHVAARCFIALSHRQPHACMTAVLHAVNAGRGGKYEGRGAGGDLGLGAANSADGHAGARADSVDAGVAGEPVGAPRGEPQHGRCFWRH